jgi:hypothetical protein
LSFIKVVTPLLKILILDGIPVMKEYCPKVYPSVRVVTALLLFPNEEP